MGNQEDYLWISVVIMYPRYQPDMALAPLALALLSLQWTHASTMDCWDVEKKLWDSGCQAPCSLCLEKRCTTSCQESAGNPVCFPSCAATACHPTSGETCQVDGFVGSYLIHEDSSQRVWNFTLKPGKMTTMHRHDFDYTFVVVKPSQLEVFGEDGNRLFDFWAEGTKAFRIKGDFLEPVSGSLPWPVPRIHSARNIGASDYHEILFESKSTSCDVIQD